jgi:hypothetical protein
VLNRGNERRAIFRDQRDYEGFLERHSRARCPRHVLIHTLGGMTGLRDRGAVAAALRVQ